MYEEPPKRRDKIPVNCFVSQNTIIYWTLLGGERKIKKEIKERKGHIFLLNTF